MLLKVVGAIAVGLALAALAVPATAGQVERVTTTVETWGANLSDEPDTLLRGNGDARVYGRVVADKPTCAKLRKLSIFGERDGADLRLGTGYSDSLGYWSINAHITDITAEVYAIAPKAKRGKRTVCKADRSPAIAIAFRAGGAERMIPATVEIDDYHGEDDEAVFPGVVSSTKRACEKQRTVVIIGRNALGETRVFGSDKTNRQGRFEVREPIPFEGQELSARAKLKRARLDNGTKCKGARSEEISLGG